MLVASTPVDTREKEYIYFTGSLGSFATWKNLLLVAVVVSTMMMMNIIVASHLPLKRSL